MISDIVLMVAVLGIAMSIYTLIATVIVLRYWFSPRRDNVISITRRRAGHVAPGGRNPQVPPRRNPSAPSTDPRYDPKQFRSNR